MFAAVLALSATTCMTAYGQEDPVTPSAPTEPAAPPAGEKPAEKPAGQQADPARADLKATAEVAAGPFLVGQVVPVELTLTNSGAGEATEVSAWTDQVSGSWFGINPDAWDGLKPPFGQPSTLKIAAGVSRTFNLKGMVNGYQGGNAKFRFRVNAKNVVNPFIESPIVEIALVEPKKTGKVSGVLWGDANGNGVMDPGEGLAGAQAYLYGGNPNTAPKTRTDANGRFTFTDVELRTWNLSMSELPGGWVLKHSNEPILVDGGDSTSELRYQAVRPLSDQLAAAMRILPGDHVAGGKVTIEFTLTNKGGTDLKGVVVSCNRSGNGPGIELVDGLGDLHWSKGATIPAGQSRGYTVIGQIPVAADEYGYAALSCDFGYADDSLLEGYPVVSDYVRVGNGTTDTYGSIYVDRNGNGWQDSEGEVLTGVSFSLVDPKTGQVAGTATGEGEHGYAHFNNIPKGLYEVRVNGPYKVKYRWSVETRYPGWAVEVLPDDQPGGGQPAPEPVKIAPVAVHRAAAGGLAVTGANVMTLGLLGTSALLLGAAAVFFARRRTA